MSTGTSMSTPVVAGAVALWLQANPHLTQQAVKDIISRTSRHPDASADYPNNEYGYGEIDVYRGLLDVLGLNGINSLSTYQPSGVNIFSPRCWVEIGVRPADGDTVDAAGLQHKRLQGGFSRLAARW